MNTLCITSSFKIKNIIGRPAMFVVTDELPGRIGTESSLARTAETEKDGCIALRTFVSRTVHTEDVFFPGQEEIEDRKDPLFYFAGITGAGDQDQCVTERDRDGIGSACTAGSRIEGKTGGGEDLPVGPEIFQLL